MQPRRRCLSAAQTSPGQWLHDVSIVACIVTPLGTDHQLPAPAMYTHRMAVDTIILAFCEDCEVHDGHPKFAPPLLMDTMGGPVEPAHSETVKPVAH